MGVLNCFIALYEFQHHQQPTPQPHNSFRSSEIFLQRKLEDCVFILAKLELIVRVLATAAAAIAVYELQLSL